MFQSAASESVKSYRHAVVGILLLSAAALAVTVWIMIDFLKEQSIVEGFIRQLPPDAKGTAEGLIGELRWQFRLAILVVLNVIVTGIAMVLLWRAYHESQASLRDFKTLASIVLDGMDLGIVTTNSAGIVTSINKRGLELLEANAECIGRHLDHLSSIPLSSFLNEWILHQSPAFTRVYRSTLAGRPRSIRTSCQKLSDYDGNEVGNVVQFRDVTERELIEEQMRRMERYMGLGSFAAGLQHEIKNPLAALSLHVQLLDEQLESEKASDENKQALTVIRNEVNRIGRVLEGFRDFAAVDSLNLSTFDLVAVLNHQIELVRPQAEQVKIDIVLEASSKVILLEGDQARLEQVFLNLIINAIEAMEDGGRLRIKVFVESEMVRIEVIDSGCGVSENLKEQIFAPYFSTKVNGTGLGLALCDKIVRQHFGTLGLQSNSAGATFQVALPVRRPEIGDVQSSPNNRTI